MQDLGFLLLPCAHDSPPPGTEHVTYHRERQAEASGWRTWLEAVGTSCGGGEAAEQQQLGPIQLLDAAAVELLEACGRVIHDNRLTKCITAELLRPDEAAPAPAAQPPAAVPQLPCSFVKLLLRVPDTLLQPGAWKRSPAAATVFKQLYPCDVELGVAVQQAMLPRQAAHQQQQQGQEGSAAAAAASAARYTLLSCFRELPSVNTAPPPMAISIQQTQAPQQPQQMPQQQQLQGVQPQQEQEQQLQPQPAAAGVTASDAVPAPPASSSSGGSTSLADVPAEVMGQLLSLLTARDLAALASTCRGLRAATWEAVPGLRLVLYPHQRNALSWMLHREVNGGGEMPHPFVRSAVTGGEAGGWTVYLNQVTGELSTEPPERLCDIRGGFFCDEPGLGKTVTALSLILKTQGTVPSAPCGASVTWLRSPDGRRLGYYTPPDPACSHPGQAPAGAAAAAGGTSPGLGGRRHSSSGSLRRNSSSYASLGAVGGGGGLRGGGAAHSRQSSVFQMAPSLRGGSSSRRARAAAAAAAAAAAEAPAATPPAPDAGIPGSGGDNTAGAVGTGSMNAAAGQGADGQQQQHPTRQSARAHTAGLSGDASAYGHDTPPAQSAAKRQKLCNGYAPQQQQQAGMEGQQQAAPAHLQQQQQLQSASTTNGAMPKAVAAAAAAAAACGGGEEINAAEGSVGAEEPAPETDVVCDHCNKWRRLPQGYKLPDADPDTPWYCCLHPDPQLASCLVPEEPHDMNTSAATDPTLAHVSYANCIGFRSAHPAAAGAGAAEGDEELHAQNVAHFSAVVAAAASGIAPGDDLLVLGWLAKQRPEALLTGVTVPRELRQLAPEYGRLFSMMALKLAADVAATQAATTAAAAAAAKPPRRASSSTGAGRSKPAQNKQRPKQQKKKRRRRSSDTSDSDDDFCITDSGSGSDSDFGVDLGRQQRRSPARRASSSSSRPGRSRSSSQGPAGQQGTQQAAAAQPEGAAGGPSTSSSGGGGGAKAKKVRRLSAAAAAAAAHTWCQPASLYNLHLDMAALREALDKGADSTPRMFLSSATLVIVPVTLIPHWQQQIRKHLMPRRLRVLVLGSATAVAGGQDAGQPGSRGSSRALKASSTAAGGGGAAESVCPPAHEVAWGYDVVITTFQRLSSDWSMRSDPRLAERLVLLKVHFLRIIVDEGHSLGASLGLTNKLAMAVQLTAQRRWVMTGTPTPSTSSGSGAAYLQPLLAFLHQEPFGSSRAAWDGAVAKPLEAGSEAGRAAAGGASAGLMLAEWGRQQLLQLLTRVMIRSCKADLALLPPCYKKVTLLDFAPDHAKSYNALVEVIRRNLLLADWCDDAHVESLLNQKQSVWAKEMLSNVRLACCVAGGMNLVPKEEDVLESLQLLSGKLEVSPPSKEQCVVLVHTDAASSSQQPPQQPASQAAADAAAPNAAGTDASGSQQAGPEGMDAADAAAAVAAGAGGGGGDVPSGLVLRRRWYYTGPNHPLHAIEEALREGCVCQVCQSWSPFPLVTPCGHLQCTDCCAVSRTRCRVCQKPFNMQPVDDPERYKTNPQPKWEVPLELIEWQPVYHQAGATGVSGGEWSADWRITRSTKVLLLVQRLAEVGIYTPPKAPSQAPAAGTPTATAAAAAAAAAGAGAQGAAGVAESAGPAPISSSAGAGGLKGCLKGSSAAAASTAAGGQVLTQPQQHHHQQQQPAVKAIVFSQFWMHVQLVAAELSARGVAHYVLKRDMPARDKQAAVREFTATRHNCCLVMDASGALGLDLSFVRYIFLMEPIPDASLEQQVVSRAHRMGAVAPVHVELLAMKHTAEEHMVNLRHQAALGKLSGLAADAAASKAAAAVAEAAAAGGTSDSTLQQQDQQWQQQRQQEQQQQQQQEEEELGGSTATARAVDVSNITDFVAVGAGENQLNNRALRNLLLLHLRKVNVAELPELPVHEGPASLPGGQVAAAAAAGQADGGVQSPGSGGPAPPELWSDVVLLQLKREDKQQPQQQIEQQVGAADQQPAGAARTRRVMFAEPDSDSAPAPGEAAGASGAGKPDKKRIRFADDPA